MASELTFRDVYKTLWKCRDFEISTLWQRSALLGTFMVLTYAGYGALLLSVFKDAKSIRWELFNLMAVGTCCFGTLFSMLWIMMLKGSKRWYETCEAALNAFKEEMPDEVFHDEEVRENSAFGVFYSSKTRKFLEEYEVDDCPFSAAAGRYSVSRVAIAVGQISIAGWLFLGALHLLALRTGQTVALGLLHQYAFQSTFVLFCGCMVFAFVFLGKHVESSSAP